MSEYVRQCKDEARTLGNNPRTFMQRINFDSIQTNQLEKQMNAEKMVDMRVNNQNRTRTLQLSSDIHNTSTHINYTPTGDYQDSHSQVMGISMRALLDPKDPLHGTDTSAFERHGIYLMNEFKDGRNHATALHLLNANLGGLAIDSNLFPGTNNKNGQHLKSAETEVKNEVLTLKQAQDNELASSWRVKYEVDFLPPPYLTPENWEDVELQTRHTYIDGFGNEHNELVIVSEDPDGDLQSLDWGIANDSAVNQTDLKYTYKDTYGEYASYFETLEHTDDPSTSSRERTNKHLSPEDYQEYRKGQNPFRGFH